jgi:Protein of unknown function (DUF998)
VLLAIFGLGVLRLAGQNKALRITAGLLVANGVLSIIATAAFPSRWGEITRPASVGVVVAAAALLSILAAIASGALAWRGWFRLYSLGTLLLFAVLTVLGFVAQSAPHIGFQERTMGYISSLWVLMLAIALLHVDARTRRRTELR